MGFPEPGRGESASFSAPHLLCSVILIVLGVSFSASAAEDDEYLKAIEMETLKLERKAGDGEDGGAAHRRGGGDGFSVGLTIDGFENELQAKYTGSAVFYKKLPRRIQEEIYQEYVNGASYTQLRKKIMDRYLGK